MIFHHHGADGGGGGSSTVGRRGRRFRQNVFQLPSQRFLRLTQLRQQRTQILQRLFVFPHAVTGCQFHIVVR